VIPNVRKTKLKMDRVLTSVRVEVGSLVILIHLY
jgi:hypothetical protein